VGKTYAMLAEARQAGTGSSTQAGSPFGAWQ
jgi:hypothetical protein